MLRVGQVILGKFKFNNGDTPNSNRPYLIVEVNSDSIGVLVISSLEGKAHKLAFSTNMVIQNYSPPLKMPSFVKLDSKIIIPLHECVCITPVCNGISINNNELKKILACIK